jgi:hypothetical protein
MHFYMHSYLHKILFLKKNWVLHMADHLSHLQFEESVELCINEYMRDHTLLKV